MITVKVTRANGETTKNMARASILGPMATFTKDNTNKTRDRVWEQ